MKNRKIKKGNLLFLVGCILLFISVITFVVMFLINSHNNSEMKKKIDAAHNYTAYQNVVVTDNDLDGSLNDLLAEGIKNWVNSSLGMDDSYSSDSKTKLLRKLYDSIEDRDQEADLLNTLTEFYSAKTITTENIDVSITEAKEATLNGKSVGLVNCKATISGTRDGIDFQNVYDLSLLLSYDTDPVGIYVVKSIVKE
ncbi:MAG: hypothetical protein UF329_01915 [Bulleidia sp.]|nr:hypothetical protein [Bulleidia sp.]